MLENKPFQFFSFYSHIRAVLTFFFLKPRHNPFNRASLIVVESPENTEVSSKRRDQESSETGVNQHVKQTYASVRHMIVIAVQYKTILPGDQTDTVMLFLFLSEPGPPLKYHPAGETNQTSGGSITSEGSSVGFRPVPKKRTFLSRRACSQSESNGSDSQVGSIGIVPAPRRSLQRGSSGSSNQSYLKGPDEVPLKGAAAVSNQVSQSAQPSNSADENPRQPQVLSNSSLERDRNRNPSSITRERSVENTSYPVSSIKLPHPSITTHDLSNFRPATYTTADTSVDREIPQKSGDRDKQTQREHAVENTVTLPNSSIQDSDFSSSVGTALGQEELSLTLSTVGKFSNKKYLFLINCKFKPRF